MSGGTSALWRTSLCGVAMALLAFSTGCAVDASDVEDDTGAVEAQADSTVILIDTGSPSPGTGLQVPTSTTQSKTKQAEQIVEPEPEPWKPHGRARATLDSSPGSSSSHK